jgi:hypothetical protein
VGRGTRRFIENGRKNDGSDTFVRRSQARASENFGEANESTPTKREKSQIQWRMTRAKTIVSLNNMLSYGSRFLFRRVTSRTRSSQSFLKEERIFPSGIRHLSSKQKEDGQDAAKNKTEEDSLKETIRKMQEGDKKTFDGNAEMDEKFDGFLRSAAGTWSTLSEEVGKTWGELLKSGERKSINKKIAHPEDTVEGEAEYTGPVEIMVIDESEHYTAWERMQKRLTEAPIISGKLCSWCFLF